ncbi:PIN domain-containing protein [Bacteroides reticulotermitis]|uniref:PIN domain-containing protein n=1 Tax=Bacteroides reticulotermitis TaxID=1133319 RepID=UPI003A86A6EF
MKRRELKSKNIFLDTSVFEKNNILEGTKLKILLKNAEDGWINLYSNEIIIQEVKARIEKRILESKSCIKKFLKENEVPIRIFRNSDTAEWLATLRKGIDYDLEVSKLCQKIDKIVENTPITLIPYDTVDIKSIFDKYFKEEPPFKEGLKKSEFPDAFVLASIEQWCKGGILQKMVIISSDKDWLSYKSSYIIPVEDIETVLKFVAESKESMEDRITFTDRLFDKNLDTVKQLIDKTLNENDLYFEARDDSEIYQYKVSNITVTGLSLMDIEEKYAEYYVEISFSITADISFEDYDNAYYDKETGEYLGLETIHTTIEREELFTKLILKINYSVEDISDFNLSIISVNDNEPIDIERDSIYC